MNGAILHWKCNRQIAATAVLDPNAIDNRQYIVLPPPNSKRCNFAMKRHRVIAPIAIALSKCD